MGCKRESIKKFDTSTSCSCYGGNIGSRDKAGFASHILPVCYCCLWWKYRQQLVPHLLPFEERSGRQVGGREGVRRKRGMVGYGLLLPLLLPFFNHSALLVFCKKLTALICTRTNWIVEAGCAWWRLNYNYFYYFWTVETQLESHIGIRWEPITSCCSLPTTFNPDQQTVEPLRRKDVLLVIFNFFR